MSGHIRKRPPTKTNPKGRFQVRWMDEGDDGSRRERSETFTTKRAAEKRLAQVNSEKERGDYVDPRLAETPLGEVAVDWLLTKRTGKARTKLGYEAALRNHVIPRLGHMPVSKIKKRTIRDFITEMEDAGSAPGTVRNCVRSVVKPILDRAVEDEMIRTNPAIGVKLPSSGTLEPLFLTPAEVNVLAKGIAKPYDLLVLFAAYTGLRAGEIAALRIKNLDLFRCRVTVAESATEVKGQGLVYGPTKTYQTRVVSLPTFLRDPLTSHVASQSLDPEAFVFLAAQGGPLRHGNFYRRYFKPAVRKSLPERLHGLRFHDLRHTCVSLLINETNANPKAIQARLGHSSIQVTFDRYGHLFPGMDEQLSEKLDDVYARTEVPVAADVVALAR